MDIMPDQHSLPDPGRVDPPTCPNATDMHAEDPTPCFSSPRNLGRSGPYQVDPRLEPPLTLDTAFFACLVAVFFTFLSVWRVLLAVMVCARWR